MADHVTHLPVGLFIDEDGPHGEVFDAVELLLQTRVEAVEHFGLNVDLADAQRNGLLHLIIGCAAAAV